MKTIACFIKTFKENIRDWKILILAIVFAPFFIYLMYIYLGDSGSASYRVAIVNNDTNGNITDELIKEWEKLETEEGKKILTLKYVADSQVARNMIKNKDADLFITIPDGFSDSLSKVIVDRSADVPEFISYGDQANMKYLVAASFIDYASFSYISRVSGVTIPLNVKYEYAGRGKSLTEFDLYVPALLVLSIIMMLFTAGASIVREIEKDTITRLSLSELKSSEFMAAMSLNQVIIGLICLLLTLVAAYTTGYKTSGSITLFLFAGALTCFSVISISIITASFIRTMFGLLTLGCFPFFILMFFSDCFIPLPKIDLFALAGNQVYLNDILPTATATRVFNKILNYGSTFRDVLFEMVWISALSFLYFIVGIMLFRRKYNY